MNNNDIEEDIEIIEDTIRNYNITGKFKNPNYEDLDNISTAIENILADRERLEKENEELKEYIFIAPNLDEMTAIKYLEIQKKGYFRGRNEEQQKAKPIINKLEAKANQYDSLVERIKENLDERKQKYNEILNDYGNIDTDVIFNIPNANVRKRLDELSFEIVILQELIEEE